MKITTLQKLGGISIVVGSALLTIYAVLFSTLLPIKEINNDFTLLVINPHWTWLATISLIGLTLMIFGFTAVYSKIYEEAGWLGFAGYFFAIVSFVLQAGKVCWEIFVFPVVCSNSASAALLRNAILQHSFSIIIFKVISGITILLGIVFFCIALIRSKIFPKIAGILIFVGALMYGLRPLFTVLVANSGTFIFSIGCLFLGVSLFRKNSKTIHE
jgi:hypothetical protein